MGFGEVNLQKVGQHPEALPTVEELLRVRLPDGRAHLGEALLKSDEDLPRLQNDGCAAAKAVLEMPHSLLQKQRNPPGLRCLRPKALS
eukprot:11517273-Alexandrium_andersonii.AAC.1